MIVDVREERILVTSDTHLGSFFCNSRRGIVKFLEYACAQGYNLCINGDGIDVLHTSMNKIVRETAELLHDCRPVLEKANITIYYTIGNHDIVLEHYLAEWGRLRLVPFLNLHSGDKRIRIEHGHLYDPFFTAHPAMQDALTRFGGLICRIYPPWYHWYKIYGLVKYRYLGTLTGKNGARPNPLMQRGEGTKYLEAAEELAQRGFDAVIFGHTHNPCALSIDHDRAKYFNTGSWFDQPYFVEINRGDIQLQPLNLNKLSAR